MTNLTRYRMGVTCTASAATYYQYVEGGYLFAWAFTPATASAFATGSTAVIDIISDIRSTAIGVTTHDGITFTGTSAAARRYPRNKQQTTAGATAADLTGGEMIPIAQEFIRVVMASGGASGQGWFDFYIDGR